jgi:uncharacterized protein (TIGR02466 family)
MQTNITSSPIISCEIDKLLIHNHEQTKIKLLNLIEDIYKSNINYNTEHHAELWQSPPGLQTVTSFETFCESPEMRTYSELLINRYKIKPTHTIAVTNLWVSITPPGSLKMPKRYTNAIATGTYFLQTPKENASINFKKPIPQEWYKKVEDPFNRTEWNSVETQLAMEEGYMYIWPSYLETYTTTNVSDNPRISIDFTLDVVHK